MIEITGRLCPPIDPSSWLKEYRSKIHELNNAFGLEDLGIRDRSVDRILDRMKQLDAMRPSSLAPIDQGAFTIIAELMDGLRQRRAEGKWGLID